MRKKRQPTEINAGSIADIAFLLLIFFLVVTTIDQDQGILVRLPPFAPDEPIELNESRVLSIKINSSDQVLLEGNIEEVENVHAKTFEFLKKKFLTEIQPVISIQTDRSTSYNQYLIVYSEILLGYKNLWDEYALTKHKTSYASLNKNEQDEIRKKYPLIISEAEPVDLGN